MPRNRAEMFKDLDRLTVALRSFFRAGHPLSEAEQLFIENRLMILQIEYSLWAKDRLGNTKKAGKNKEVR